MCRDEIVEEVRRARRAYAERFGGDLDAMARDLMERQGKSGRKVVSLPPKAVPRRPPPDG